MARGGLPLLTLALNVSPRQFHLTDLARAHGGCAGPAGFRGWLELRSPKAPWPSAPKRPPGAGAPAERCIAVDDFGTGYSSLASSTVPHRRAQDRPGLHPRHSTERDDMAISAAIIAMGHSMALSVLAEGVETEGRWRSCAGESDTYQGYLCSRPVPADGSWRCCGHRPSRRHRAGLTGRTVSPGMIIFELEISVRVEPVGNLCASTGPA